MSAVTTSRAVILVTLIALVLWPFYLQSQDETCCGKLSRDIKGLNNTTRTISEDLSKVRSRTEYQDRVLRDSIKSLSTGILATSHRVETIRKSSVEPNTIFLNRFWIFLSAVLVFFMQAGFKALEVGMSRRRHDASVGMKNLLDWLVLSLVYFLWGFGFMYGPSWGDVIGTDFFGSGISYDNFSGFFKSISGATADIQHNEFSLGIEFVLYQLAFAGTAATIVSGAMAERTALTSYAFTAVVVGGVIYPIFGHWVWGGSFVSQSVANLPAHEVYVPWLTRLGFFDFAGSTVVHSVGGWVALIGCYFIGPRTGRFHSDGRVNRERFAPNSMGYAMLGVFILWFGWWGFNGGSTLVYNEDVAPIVLNTNICGAVAGLVAFFHAFFKDRESIYEKTIGGVLGGLVAITANCNVVTAGEAIIIGIFAGWIHNMACDLLIKCRIDDPVGAVPVHLACGIWGTLCVGLFGDLKKLATLTVGAENQLTLWEQIGVQLLGIVVACIFVTSIAAIMFWFLKNTIGLRISPQEEESGKLL